MGNCPQPLTLNAQLDEYILEHIDKESDYLHRLWRATQLHLLYGRMASGHLQGRLLKMLVGMIRPKLVLEIGTYSGYSGLCIAEGLEEGAHLHTVEINDEQEDFTLPWFQNSPYADRITMHIGDALEVVPKLGLQFDLVFIDGDKRRYVDYYEMVMAHLNTGGYILADNTLWDGHVVDESSQDAQTEGIRRFNDLVAADTRVEKVILPLRDGLTIIHKK
jgi:predicted O-methyltransferase YrrM